jgi:hypothetical protein
LHGAGIRSCAKALKHQKRIVAFLSGSVATITVEGLRSGPSLDASVNAEFIRLTLPKGRGFFPELVIRIER